MLTNHNEFHTSLVLIVMTLKNPMNEHHFYEIKDKLKNYSFDNLFFDINTIVLKKYDSFS